MKFVILHHTGYREEHYDFMLEAGSALRTWTIHSLDFGRRQEAVQNVDHRAAYLDYEGPVSGNRGDVRRVEKGAYFLIDEDPDTIVARFEGTLMKGEFTLSRISEGVWELAPENSSESAPRSS